MAPVSIDGERFQLVPPETMESWSCFEQAFSHELAHVDMWVKLFEFVRTHPPLRLGLSERPNRPGTLVPCALMPIGSGFERVAFDDIRCLSGGHEFTGATPTARVLFMHVEKERLAAAYARVDALAFLNCPICGSAFGSEVIALWPLER